MENGSASVFRWKFVGKTIADGSRQGSQENFPAGLRVTNNQVPNPAAFHPDRN